MMISLIQVSPATDPCRACPLHEVPRRRRGSEAISHRSLGLGEGGSVLCLHGWLPSGRKDNSLVSSRWPWPFLLAPMQGIPAASSKSLYCGGKCWQPILQALGSVVTLEAEKIFFSTTASQEIDYILAPRAHIYCFASCDYRFILHCIIYVCVNFVSSAGWEISFKAQAVFSSFLCVPGAFRSLSPDTAAPSMAMKPLKSG